MQSLLKNQRKPTDVILASKTLICNANNESVLEDLFMFQGILVATIFGLVTVSLGSSHFSASIGLRDSGGGAVGITGDFTLNDYGVGSVIAKTDISSGANNFEKIGSDDVTKFESFGVPPLQKFMLIPKQGVNNYIGYTYTTTNAPTVGEIKFFCEYKPLSEGATLISV